MFSPASNQYLVTNQIIDLSCHWVGGEEIYIKRYIFYFCYFSDPMLVLTVLIILGLIAQSVCLVGYEFLDNRNRTARYTPQNGEMSLQLDRVPDKLAACFSVYVKFNRYSNIVPLMDFRAGFDQTSPFGAIWGKVIEKPPVWIFNVLPKFEYNHLEPYHKAPQPPE